MKFVLSLMLLIATSLPSVARDYFYSKNVNNWTIDGIHSSADHNDICVVAQNWQRRTFLNIIQDMIDGEMYILIVNPSWNIINAPGSLDKLIMSFNHGTDVRGGQATYDVVDTKTIRIRGVIHDVFLKDFLGADGIHIKMPGNISSLLLDTKNSVQAFALMTECLSAYKSSSSKNPGSSKL